MALHVNNGGNWVAPVGVSARVAGAWVDVQEVLVRQAGAWVSIWQNETLIVLTTRSTSVDLRALFDATTWASTRSKRVLVPAGVTIGADDWRGALYLAGGIPWGGSLTIDIYGALYGIGGVALTNSGEGGGAIGSEIAGASGQRAIVNLYSGGSLYAGGGAGGQGGLGGSGSYVYNSYDVTRQDYSSNYAKQATNGYGTVMMWDGVLVYSDGTLTNTYTTGNTTYSRWGTPSTMSGWSWSGIRKVITSTGSSSGGGGGLGGRGLGSNGAAASGSSGSAGGTNAGAGGTGGTGGAWGAQGSTGSTGAAGNNGAGSLGVAGGLGGRYAYGYLTLNNSGSVAGRLALS